MNFSFSLKFLKSIKHHILLVFIATTSLIVRLKQSAGFDFPFTYDQARDMLDIRVLANLYDFKISGPTTSITGLNLGPYYYLFNLPAYWVGGGNPQYLVLWNIFWFILTGIIIYIFFYKKDKFLALFASSVYLFAPQLFPITRYFWNANSVVYFIVFYLLAYINYLDKKDMKSVIVWALTSGLVIQFEAAFGSACVIFSFLYIVISRNKAHIKKFLIFLLPWFIPQIGFEIIHKFQMSKLFVNALFEKSSLLGSQMTLVETFSSHASSYLGNFEGQFILSYGWGLILLITAIVVGLKSDQHNKYTRSFLFFGMFSFIYFCIIYRHELKPWYLEGIRVLYVFIVSFGLASLAKKRKLFLFLISILLINSFYLTIKDQNRYIFDNGMSDDPKNARNLLSSIDWAYAQSKENGFLAYNYVPEIHDYSYQYMYWWYGNNAYGYIPESVSYSLENVPEYVRMDGKFKENVKISDNNNIAIIYETVDQNYINWLKQFENFCVINKQEFDWNVTAEWRVKCE